MVRIFHLKLLIPRWSALLGQKIYVLSMTVVDVASPEGEPAMVHYPWTMKENAQAHLLLDLREDVREAHVLLDLREVSSLEENKKKFSWIFCPTSHVLCCLMVGKLAVDKIHMNWPEDNVMWWIQTGIINTMQDMDRLSKPLQMCDWTIFRQKLAALQIQWKKGEIQHSQYFSV